MGLREYYPSVRFQSVSKPLGNETSQRPKSRVTCTDTDLARNLGHAMAGAILITMFHNLLAKIEHSSIVMRQVPMCCKTAAFQDTASFLEKPTRSGAGTRISLSPKVVSPCFVLCGCRRGLLVRTGFRNERRSKPKVRAFDVFGSVIGYASVSTRAVMKLE